MSEDILTQLINKGFKTVNFIDVRTAKKVWENVSLKKEKTETLFLRLCIDPSTAALSGKEEKLFVTGIFHPAVQQSIKNPGDKDIAKVMKYEVAEASD